MGGAQLRQGRLEGVGAARRPEATVRSMLSCDLLTCYRSAAVNLVV